MAALAGRGSRGRLSLTVAGVRKGARTKSGRSRVVPLTRQLRAALSDHAATYRLAIYGGKRSTWLFHHEHDQARRGAGERIGSLRRSFDKAAARAGLSSDLNQHDLRHARVTRWLAAGKPIHLVRQAMGHSTVKITEGYLHLVPAHLRQLVEEPGREELKELGQG